MDLETHTTLLGGAHGSLVLRGFQSLRKEQFLCDFTLVAEGCVFLVHKALLAAVCEYFQAVFRSGMLEAFNNRLELKGVSATGLHGVLDFIYNGELRLHQENVLEVLATASHLQMSPVIDQCCQFFIQNLSLDTIKEVHYIAEAYNLQDLKRAAHDFIGQNFTKFAKTDYFKQLPLSEICKLLKDDGLKCQSEFKLFKLVLEWIQYSKPNRESLATNILKQIRLAFFTKDELKYLSKIPFIKKNGYCNALIEKAMYFKSHPGEHIFIQSPSLEIRSRPYIVTFGSNNVSMHCCIFYEGNWYPLDNALSQPRPFTNAAAVVVRNFLFVCGGQTRDVHSSCFCFNPYTGRWSAIRPMITARRSFALAAHNFHLYAMGGITRNEEVLDSVEVYSIKNNTWTPASPLQLRVANLAACTWKGNIFTAAGVDENCLHLKDFAMYDIFSDKWHPKPNTLGIKFHPAMFSLENCVYLIDLDRTEGISAHLEQFHVRTNQWTRIQLNHVLFSRPFSAALIDGWLYFVGRNVVDDGPSKRYNVASGEMEEIRAYPLEVEAPLCVTLCLPHRFLMKRMLSGFDM